MSIANTRPTPAPRLRGAGNEVWLVVRLFRDHTTSQNHKPNEAETHGCPSPRV